ncbi:uncharacterized protein CANTADRAFT_71679 [Suhomyces tanzawaensis NRRL Y-17324]|uniref:Mediator of RNA polymerase II transcription subunit 13 n=1 Tax=Suhomyces tanzawaensis NRRL Y-17324 TaxID=984487 RepID=A0A1E4SC75_9ASCO|nr:uncharacterized protein CANTADRAFT_71679 [Suhomyces tanzawaensis NRRL Y-17324]ODV77117.1 hypothetical protein CANTADRAFT_71679 [Suhomyces tanzawaensis NRRL Y-17324]
MFEASPSNISTHYYKLAHINSINYSIYTSNGNDQSLLELELLIRHNHPKIFITYYNKCLYHFTFGNQTASADLPELVKGVEANFDSNVFDSSKEYPTLQLKHTNLVNVDVLSNPPKPSPGAPASLDENLSLANLSFLKAVKKMVLYNLSLHGLIQLFGNYCVLINGKSSDGMHSILYLDSILLSNGDLLVSVVVKQQLSLFSSSVLAIENEIDSQIPAQTDLHFVIYLIPSGIRCHLFDTVNFHKNFIKKTIDNENLLTLIKLSTGVDYFEMKQEIIWVKLIPNLKHLNNQTSSICKFIHSVDNKKFILWPWNLCLLQFGKYESTDEDFEDSTDSSNTNPLSLISDFIDFNITNHQNNLNNNNNLQQAGPAPFSIFSVNSSGNGGGSTGPTGPGHVEQSKDLNSIEHNDITTPANSDIFGLQQTPNEFFGKDDQSFQAFPAETDPSKKIDNEPQGNQDDMEIDDLFGDDGSDIEVLEPEEAQKANLPNKEQEKSKDDPVEDGRIDNLFGDDIGYEEHNEPSSVNEAKGDFDNSSVKTQLPKCFEKPTFIDIPKDQMIKKLLTPDYNDPGAPLPIMPTPVIPQSTNFGSQSAGPGSGPAFNSGPAFSSAPTFNSGYPELQDEKPTQKSVFSPIIFNPIIKSNIDTKYGKGGKFYVDKESSADPDMEKKRRNMRATSVSGFEPPFSREAFIEGERLQNKAYNPLNNPTFDDDEDEESGASETSEESDADDEMVDKIGISPPLKLNTTEDVFHPNGAGIGVAGVSNGTAIHENHLNSNNYGLNDKSMISNQVTASFGSPSSNLFMKIPPLKPDSPFYTGDLPNSMSPIDHSPQHPNQTPSQNQSTPSNQAQNTPTPSHTPNQWGGKAEDIKIGEASNYLPLILRNINVSTIPNTFLLNNLISDRLIPLFTINVDDDPDNDLELTQNNEMIITVTHLDIFLECIGPNLIYDLGLNSKGPQMGYYNDKLKKLNDACHEPIDYKLPPASFNESFKAIFPNSYQVKLAEFLADPKAQEGNLDIDSQLNFLDDITNDEDILNPNSLPIKLKTLEWNSIDTQELNTENANKYMSIMSQIKDTQKINEEDHYFKLPVIKSRVMKNENIVNLNTIGFNFWKYLNFSPLKSPKNFQILLISEDNGRGSSFNGEFLDLLCNSYNENNLGNISKINLASVESRPDLESIIDGQLLMSHNEDDAYNDTYKYINNRLNSLVELIKLDLINKTNNFEFDRPLCILFANFNEKFNSLLQISKIFRNFRIFLTHHQLPLVRIFTKIIPGNYIVKQRPYQRNQMRIISNYKLSKLSLNLYNQCPTCSSNNRGPANVSDTSLYTQLVQEPPTKIHFKFLNTNLKDNNFKDDIFLHLAYERSIDKNWISAAWSDPLGVVTHSKSWYCGQNAKRSIHDLGAISDDIWSISCECFKKLNDEMGRSSGGGMGTGGNPSGKKFLVLTRVNNVIPDDELIHWKRLSIKHKDVSLIVLSVNDSTKLLFCDDLPNSDISNSRNLSSSISGLGSFAASSNLQASVNSFEKDSNNVGFNSSPLMTSPSLGLNFHSPQQFLNVPSNFLSPGDFGPGSTNNSGAGAEGNSNEGASLPQSILHDLDSDMMGIIPKVPLPSFNSPARLGMKNGYLFKRLTNSVVDSADKSRSSYLIFEVNLLSCSNYWDLEVLMKLILGHYNKLIVLNDILGLRDYDGNINMYDLKEDLKREVELGKLKFEVEGMIPWHIAAVRKSLGYLTHILVEDS